MKTVALDIESPFGQRTALRKHKIVWQFSDLAVLPQSLRRWLRKRFARKFVGPFDVTFQEMNFRLYPSENYCDRILFGRRTLPELAEHQALSPYLKAGMVFVDIGANIGSYSAYVGAHCDGDVTLLGFEPHPRTFQKLSYNLASNSLSLEKIFNCGIGPKEDFLELWSDGGSNIGHTSMLKEGTANPVVSVKVPVRPLLDVCKEQKIDQIDVLKIDIEGFEDRALAPFLDDAPEELLPRAILLETAHGHLWERNLLEQLAQLGYNKVFSTPENQLLERI